MNSSTALKRIEDNSEGREIKMPDEKVNDKQLEGSHSLLIMTLISLIVMFTAVGMIYYYTKFDPEIVHKNDQTTEVSENKAYVNPESIQQLENDTSNITMKPVENSTPFIICGGVFMLVMAGAFIYVKVAESKED